MRYELSCLVYRVFLPWIWRVSVFTGMSMNNLTIRWLTNFMIGVGTGFLVTGFAALLIGDLTDVDTIRAGALMATSSIFLIATSFAVAMLEDKS